MTMLNAGGANIEAIAKMMGHSDPQVTRMFYAEYIEEEIAFIYDAAIQRADLRRK